MRRARRTFGHVAAGKLGFVALDNAGASFTQQTVSTAQSDADHSVWFQAGIAGCETCSRFIGDYIGADIDTLGRVHVLWTDMRRSLSIPALGRTGKAQDAEYARR